MYNVSIQGIRTLMNGELWKEQNATKAKQNKNKNKTKPLRNKGGITIFGNVKADIGNCSQSDITFV